MLIRLIYASEAAQPMRPTDIDELLSRAQVANQVRDLTGALAFSHRAYLQALEGARETVCELYTRLARDTRHRRLVLLACEDITERAFADWSMGFAAADASHRTLFLKHGPSSQFDPHVLTSTGALRLLQDMTRTAPRLAAAA
jgi:hypothetical protein